MSEGRPSSLSSRFAYGGPSLRHQYPINRAQTFRPSGNPETDPPERERVSEWDEKRAELGLDRPEGAAAWDARIAGPSQEHRYCKGLRFKQNTTPRARKRALERQARRSRSGC